MDLSTPEGRVDQLWRSHRFYAAEAKRLAVRAKQLTDEAVRAAQTSEQALRYAQDAARALP